MGQSIKSRVKHTLFGPPGVRLRGIRRGLLAGLQFHVDTASKTMRLIALDEREIAGVAKEFALRANTALDIGANDGWYTLFFASTPNMQKVFAFEPDMQVATGMSSNFDANDSSFRAKTTIVHKMVGSENNDTMCSVDAFADQFVGTVLLKIDVDGGELDVLKGAQNTLKTSKCILVIETHSPELERDCIAYLRGLGYQCRIITKGWYRAMLPEGRTSQFNQWFVAERGDSSLPK